MKARYIGIFLMLMAIATISFQIGAMAKYEDDRYDFLLPIGIALLSVGLLVFYSGNAKQKKDKEM